MFLSAAASASEGTGEDFARYSVILDRKPFGLPPAPETAEDGAPVVPQDSFATYVRLTAMMQQEGGGIRVGFVDKKQKDKVYMLSVGAKEDDYEVMEANLSSEIARIRKGQEEQWLSMKTAGAVAAPAGSEGKIGTPPPQKPVQVADVRPSGPTAGLLAGLRRQSRYAAIRRAEIESEKRAEDAKRLGVFREPPPEDDDDADNSDPDPPPQAPDVVQVEEEDTEDDSAAQVVLPGTPVPEEDSADEADNEDDVIREAEIQAHLQNYQKELIRQGLPPLPIPLTAKTDAELVKEGTLAPLPASTDEDEP